MRDLTWTVVGFFADTEQTFCDTVEGVATWQEAARDCVENFDGDLRITAVFEGSLAPADDLMTCAEGQI